LWHTPSVPLLLVALASQLLIARFSSGSFFGSDLYTMQNVLYWECNATIETFLPPVRCLGSIIELIFRYPLLYLISIVLLKTVTFLFLYLIFVELDRHDPVVPTGHIVPVLALVFLIVIIRQLHFGQDILLRTDLHTRMWAQPLILFSLLLFIRKNFLGSSAALGTAVFFQAVNSLNIFFVIVSTALLQTLSKFRFRQFLMLTLPFLAALLIQYLAAYGLPDFSSGNQEVAPDAIVEVKGDVKSSSVPVNITVTDWYEFVYAQDRDDMSLLYLFNSKLGFAYIAFQLIGIALILIFLASNPERWGFSKEILVICIATYFILFVSVLIEYFQWPRIFLKAQIVVQPRRLLYVPLIFLSFVFVKFAISAVFSGSRCSHLASGSLFGAIAIAFWLIEFASPSPWFISERYLQLILYSGVLFGLLLSFFFDFKASSLALFFRLAPACAVVFVLAKGLVHASPTTIQKLDTFFGTVEQREFKDYLLVSDQLSDGGSRMADLINASEWFNTQISSDSRILTMGFEEDWEMIFQSLNQRHDGISIVSSNVYRYRGAMHYNFETYRLQIGYFEDLLGIKSGEMWRKDGTTKINGLDTWMRRFSDNQLAELRAPGGDQFNFIFSASELPISWPIIYSNPNFFVYRDPSSAKN
jgi:hypothetical protein